MPRTQVVKKIWEYIKEHNLQDPKNKRRILLDDKLETVFTAPMDMFNMNKQLSRHVYTDEPAAGSSKPRARAKPKPKAEKRAAAGDKQQKGSKKQKREGERQLLPQCACSSWKRGSACAIAHANQVPGNQMPYTAHQL